MRAKFIFAFLLIFIGVGVLIEQTTQISIGEILSDWWPVLLIAVGVSQLFDNTHSKLGALGTVMIGVVFLAWTLDLIGWELFRFAWPAALILVGIWMLLPKSFKPKPKFRQQDKLDIFALFSGVENKLQTRNFSGGTVIAAFGGADIDLRQADFPAGSQVTLDVVGLFGGVDLKIPRNWQVKLQQTPLFGGVEDRSDKSFASQAPVLELNATAIFGGVEIRN